MMPVVVVLGCAILMMLVELRAPGRNWPRVRGWWPRALLLNASQVGIVFISGSTWDHWFPSLRLWDAGGLGFTGGAVAGYLAITFVYYWWHRARHQIPVLWRWLHQVHHSPQRIEVITSFYKHPLEILVNGALSSFILYAIVGVDAAAGAFAVALTGLAELFYHWNVRTPYWLGFIFQRPESHCIHHQYGKHRNNYSDLPLWDMLFGTFENPGRLNALCGFGPEGEHRLAEMLAGRDIHAEKVTHDPEAV